MLTADAHPLLDAGALITDFPAPLGDLATPAWLRDLLLIETSAPLESDDAVRKAVRDLLRHGGYRPTGRGKPASEYLLRAAGERLLAPINVAVDVCNAVSLHSGLPISVVDLDRARSPFRIALGGPGTSYVFNPAGQEIQLQGLLCLHDEEGPCGNAVKDSQRTKTSPQTRRTLSVVWGTRTLGDRTARTVSWYQGILERLGAKVDILPLASSQAS